MTNEGGGQCWNCGHPLSALDYGRQDSCPKCGKDTRVCKGCTFYDRTAHNECREPQADRVLEKEKSNFCDYFKPAHRLGSVAGSAGPSAPSKDQLKAAAEALFKKPK